MPDKNNLTAGLHAAPSFRVESANVSRRQLGSLRKQFERFSGCLKRKSNCNHRLMWRNTKALSKG